MSTTIYVNAISLVAPGLPDWRQSQSVLSGKEKYTFEDLPTFSPAILPANERRRTTQLIKLALHAAEECLDSNLVAAENYATVFASSDGDHGIIDKICKALTLPEHPVSPTLFHNSVHNAPSGYWAIAAKAQHSSNSLSACDESFAAGLVEASTFALVEQQPVLFVAYDYPAPMLLDSARHLQAGFAVAMCLSANKEQNSIVKLELHLDESNTHTKCNNSGLEHLRTGNPAARSLPLLQAISNNKTQNIVVPYLQSTSLNISVKAA